MIVGFIGGAAALLGAFTYFKFRRCNWQSRHKLLTMKSDATSSAPISKGKVICQLGGTMLSFCSGTLGFDGNKLAEGDDPLVAQAE